MGRHEKCKERRRSGRKEELVLGKSCMSSAKREVVVEGEKEEL